MTSSHQLVLIKRIVSLLGLYTVCRLLFYFFNFSYFSGAGSGSLFSVFFYGIYFDLSTVAMLNLVYIILFLLPFPFREKKGYDRMLRWLFIVVNSAALLANCADLVYFQFTIRR